MATKFSHCFSLSILQWVLEEEQESTSPLTPRIIDLYWNKVEEPCDLNLEVYLHGSMNDKFVTISLPVLFPASQT